MHGERQSSFCVPVWTVFPGIQQVSRCKEQRNVVKHVCLLAQLTVRECMDCHRQESNRVL